ncbi:MAG: DUF2071 domain-containing protein [Bacteroidetes bacterium]|nr:MAG: DUF2071 domain-containing protein [Bacteroidota bacterium]
MTFLRAEWKDLIMASYAIDPRDLKAHVPRHAELDLRDGVCYVSLVGFLFANTRVLGLRIPFHETFEEVNLRFYVRVKEGNEWKRGTVFIREIVPRAAISLVANTVYGEHYSTMAMDHRRVELPDTQEIEYRWRHRGEWNHLRVVAGREAQEMAPESEEAFIAEHYWGYNKLARGRTGEYQVVHPPWRVYQVQKADILCRAAALYGDAFSYIERETPASVFLAEGSEVSVLPRKILR